MNRAKVSPRHGDGRSYSGECLCHGVVVSGPVAKSRPEPYMAQTEPFGGKHARCVFLVSETGGHDVRLSAVVEVDQ